MPFERHRLRVVGLLTAGLALAASGLSVTHASAAPSTPSSSPSVQITPNSPATQSPTAKQPDRATFGVAPVPLGKNDVRSLFSFQIGAGGSYSDRVALLNYAATPIILTVFAADLSNAADGGLTVGLQSQRILDAGGWVRLAKPTQTVRVPARTSRGPGGVVLPFSIRVPANASPGDHGAAIVASLSTLGKNPQGQNVRLDQRIATRVYLRVSGTAAPALAIENLKARYHAKSNPFAAGSATVTYTVRNTGNIKLGAKQTVSVSGLFGAKATASGQADLGLLFPGASVQVTVQVSDVQATGPQKVRVALAPLVTADETTIHAAPVEGSASFMAWPWGSMLAVISLLAVIGLAFWLRRRRKRRLPSGGRHGGSSRTVKIAETIGS